MKAISLCRSAIVFAGLFWAVTVACAGPAQAQTSTQQDAATPPQAEAQAAQNTPKKKPVKSSVWHHFGERDSAPVAGQYHPGTWHYFGPNHGTANVVPAETDSRQTSGRTAWPIWKGRCGNWSTATAGMPRTQLRRLAGRSPSGGTRSWLPSRELIPAT